MNNTESSLKDAQDILTPDATMTEESAYFFFAFLLGLSILTITYLIIGEMT